MGVTRSLGRIRVDGQDVNLEDSETIIRHVGSVYRTSRMAAEFRLRELNILYAPRRGGLLSVREIVDLLRWDSETST